MLVTLLFVLFCVFETFQSKRHLNRKRQGSYEGEVEGERRYTKTFETGVAPSLGGRNLALGLHLPAPVGKVAGVDSTGLMVSGQPMFSM